MKSVWNRGNSTGENLEVSKSIDPGGDCLGSLKANRQGLGYRKFTWEVTPGVEGGRGESETRERCVDEPVSIEGN